MSRAVPLLAASLLLACEETPARPVPPACASACDCPAGQACTPEGCRTGTEAVYCCDACPPGAPAAQACQRKDGAFARCGGP